jgi:hypothetical protein
MSQSEHSCKARIEQGLHKGKQCSRPQVQGGFCGKHQKQATIVNGIENGKQKCYRYRCTNTFISTDKSVKYCDSCSKDNDYRMQTAVLCKWEGKCKSRARESGFCGKHEPRALLMQKSSETGVRICDDGKRACKRETIGNKLKCEECLEKSRRADTERYAERRENLSSCLACGKEMGGLLEGIRGIVQQCSECYEKQRVVEDARERTRNYSEEKKTKLDKYLVSYIQGAQSRNIAFELTKEVFNSLVNMSCYYCGTYNESEVIGIDRLDSDKNYTVDNCVPCCKICNFMKGALTKYTFISQAHKIAEHTALEGIVKPEQDILEDSILSSHIAPLKVAELFRNGKLHLYIEACIRDKRSPLFIERLKSITDTKMKYREFKDFFRLCCKNDSKLSGTHGTYTRSRISLKEIYAHINNNNTSFLVELYQSIHGKMEGFAGDIQYIATEWNTMDFHARTCAINKIVIKYRNKRANSTKV